MKQLYTRIRKLEARLPVSSNDPLSEVFALSLSRLSIEHLERMEEVLALCARGEQLKLNDAQQAASDRWDAELRQAAKELPCTALLSGWEARA